MSNRQRREPYRNNISVVRGYQGDVFVKADDDVMLLTDGEARRLAENLVAELGITAEDLYAE